MKYRINSNGFIVAERDIYSLGGFIPKGSVGGRVASEKQLSQDGDCWVAGGDISGRPDVRVKDNAYIGTFTPGANPVHTDGMTEFSGDTLIPGNISVRSLVADAKNNFFAKDSFIGVSMDVLCGPSTTTTAFPFEQGDFKAETAKGTLFTSASMRLDDTSACRSTAVLRLGRSTHLYIPIGYRARVFWAYYNTSNQLAYSGESTAVAAGLTKLDHLVYKLAVVVVVKGDGTAMTPANLLATGAKILGHISDSVNVDIRPESASGSYVMVNSSFIAETDNFGLNATQSRFLAGSMYDTTMYTKTDRQEFKPYGTFRNVERLEYTKYLDDSHRTAATRDTYISAYDCPLLRVDDTYDTSLMGTGDLVLRRCIVPKGLFVADLINGNTYEDLDFSYANEDLGLYLPGYALFTSSHRKGMYRVKAGTNTLGFVSHKGNLADTARLLRASVYLPLDGSIMEQGAYGGGSQIPYESAKSDSPIRVRTGKPLATFGLVLPSLPAGYSVKALYYLDEDFIIRSSVMDPTGVDTTYPYVVMVFRKDGDSAIPVADFVALNRTRTLEILDYTKVPEITGSAYVGAGVTVRGDVQLHGDPYVNRLLDVNMWERGTTGDASGTWDDMTKGRPLPHRYRLVDVIPVEPGGSIECGEAYYIECNIFDINGRFLYRSQWAKSYEIPENGAFLGLVLRLVSDGLVEDSDIPLANVKYVRAFKKRRYITNELDRTSPEDIRLSVDYWGQGYLQGGNDFAGKTYEELKSESQNTLRTKRPINASTSPVLTFSSGFSGGARSLDALTKLLSGQDLATNKEALSGIRVQKDPASPITPAEVAAARLVVDFTPSPRIIAPYGSATLNINGVTIRMYDNAVLSRNLNQEGEIVLQGDAVMGYDFNSGPCMCSNGHDDAIIKKP